MSSHFNKINLQTEGFADIHNITPKLTEFVENSPEEDGLLTAILPGATGAITTIEYESGLIQDFQEFLERIIPHNKEYEHNKKWGDGNGFSHIRASFVKPSLSIPFKDNKLTLGTWQQVVFCDFDNRPRSREIIVHIIN